MGTLGAMLLLLFLLFICGSFQDGNFTSLEAFPSATSLTASAVVAITIEARQVDEVTLLIQHSTSPSCPTGTGYEGHTLPSAGPSNSSANHVEPAPNGSQSRAESFSRNNVAIEVTPHVANTSNATLGGQARSIHLDPSRRDAGSQGTESDNDSPSSNNTQSQNDNVANRWIAHLRKTNDKKRKSQLWSEYDSPLESPKSKPVPKVGLTALAAGALYLATLDPDKRRKRQKTQEPDESPATTSNEPLNATLQPETRPISQEQLVAEVKGIYAGLVMVEAKCIEVDNKQTTLANSGAPPILNNEQWEALIALHRTLLHEHHDFFLASQHPSASPALRCLASKYAMPARMWRHGIHSFLELLRSRLPHSLDHLLAFIRLAYSMMGLLYETVPAFEDTWIECMGDLGRYRMAIEDDDIREREVWTGVARHWYSKASDKTPTTGRLYHHLAILARPNVLQQLFYYSKSLCVDVPFISARESILTLFDPVLDADATYHQLRLPPLHVAFVKAHALLFKNDLDGFERPYHDFIRLLDNQIGQVTRKFMEQGYHIAIANSVAMLGFGSKDSLLIRAMGSSIEQHGDFDDLSSNDLSFQAARRMANATLGTVLQRLDDPSILPFVHVSLAFMHRMSHYPRTRSLVQATFPWKSLASLLNNLLESYDTSLGTIDRDIFPIPNEVEVRPFPEDFAMRGLLWAEEYFPSSWFSEEVDYDDKWDNLASMIPQRRERILWLAVRIAQGFPSALKYDPASYNPIHTEFNKPRFSVQTGLYSSGCSSNTTSSFESSPEFDVSSAGSSSLGPDRSTRYHPTDDNPRFNGIHATLALPVEESEESCDRCSHMPQVSSEDVPYSTKGSLETLEGWLSDLINLDIALDDSKTAEALQIDAEFGQSPSRSTEKLIPPLSVATPTDLVVLNYAENEPDGKDLTKGLRSDLHHEQGDKDDREDQDENEAERDSPLPPLAVVRDSDKLSPSAPWTTSPVDDEKCPQGPPTGPAQPPSSKSYPRSPPSTLPSPRASVSPTSSGSSPNSLKPHTCTHCQKAFARISDMK
ncbi:hypothetical protein BDZ45DRAFT_81676 [Acephala macrosclerotiorum]|nr:hypothetical protein BDZ45DRAFT_81676 [Acephala macrosclerotiorum]